MLKYIIKIFKRNVLRNKVHAFINIFGLSVGIAFSLLIFFYAYHELSYDKYHENADRIYRIQRDPFAALAPSFTPLLENDFPEIERMVRLVPAGEVLIKKNERTFLEDNLLFAGEDLFEIFTIPFIKEDKSTALKKPKSLVLTESTARRLFGKQDPVGNTLELDNEYVYEVTGVVEDQPANSHFQFNMLSSYMSLKGMSTKNGEDYFLGSTNFSDNVCYSYALLKEDANPELVEQRFPEFLDRNLGKDLERSSNEPVSERIHLNMQNVTDIHLHSSKRAEMGPNGSITYVLLFILVGILILIIAAINYINLTTAKGMARSREIGLKKVIGAGRKQLITQFFIESASLVTLSFLISFIIIAFLRPYYQQFLSEAGWQAIINQQSIWLVLILFIAIILLTGIYPSLFFTRLNPVHILKGKITSGKQGNVFRQGLVIFQFFISIALISAVLIVHKQMTYVKEINLGFEKKNVMLIPLNNELYTHWNEIKDELLKNPLVASATLSKRTPGGELLDDPGYSVVIDGEVLHRPFSMPHNRVDFGFFETYGIEIVAGRDFNKQIATDKDKAVILNEAAVKKLGFSNPQDAIGLRMNEDEQVIGVSQNFHYESLHHSIRPIMTYISDNLTTASIKLEEGNLQQSVDAVLATLNMFLSGQEVNFTFLDDRIDKQYRNENTMMSIFNWFSMLAILIASIGILGLVSFSMERRIKEIGVRKVNGARKREILVLLNSGIIKWVAGAFLLSVPVVWLGMDRWMQNFVYHTGISWWVFPVAGITALALALITTSWHSWRAASRNPVEALRYE